ncbi:hypothetical protein ACFL4F_02955 [Candidatus Margulisiibacteriota bacterium]
MSYYLWILQAFLALLWVYCLYAVMNPKKVIAFTIERQEKALKFYGLEAEIRATEKTEGIIKKGHMIVLGILTVYMLLVFLFGNQFICTLAQ